MIVVDVGCARWGGDYSIERMIERYRPDVVIGFDPAKDAAKAMPGAYDLIATRTQVVIRREAAWIYDGEVRFMEDGLNGQVGDADHWPLVRCVDLARIIEGLPEGPVILKLDCEGAEYELLQHLLDTGAIHRLTRVVLEWHKRKELGKDGPQWRRELEARLRAAEVTTEQWRH